MLAYRPMAVRTAKANIRVERVDIQMELVDVEDSEKARVGLRGIYRRMIAKTSHVKRSPQLKGRRGIAMSGG